MLNSTLRVGTHELSAAGPVGEFPDWHGTRLALRLTGEDFGEVLQVAGQPDVLRGPYRGDAELRISEAGMVLEELRMVGERASLAGEVSWPEPAQLNVLSAEAAVEMADLGAFAAKLGYAGLPADPLELAARAELAGDRLILTEGNARFRNLALDFSIDSDLTAGLQGTAAALRLEGPDIDALFNNAIRFDERIIPFVLEARLQGAEAALMIEALTLTTGGGTLNVDGVVTTEDALAGTALNFKGSGNNLAALLPDFPQYAPPKNPWVLSGGIKLPSASHLELLDTRFEVGSSRVAIAGILDVEDQTRTDLVIQASGDSLKDIGQPGEVAWPDVPYALAVKLDGTMNTLNVTQAEAKWGESDLILSGSVDLTEKPFIALTGRSSTMILVDLQRALFGDPEDLEPEDDSARLFPDTPIPVDDFALFDAEIDIEIDKFRGRRSSLDDISLQLQVEDGALRFERAAFRDSFGFFDAAAVIRPEGEAVVVELKLAGEDADLGLFTQAEQAPETVPRYSLDVEISGQGQTVAEIAAGLNGDILIHSNGGEVNNALLNAFTGDFLSNVLEVLNPFVATEDFTRMECMVVNATVKEGQLKLEPGFVMRTDRVNMFVYGGVNLATEGLDLSLATQARRGIGISAASIPNPYFKVGGTLAEPALQLDPGSAALAASVATATAGLSILVRGVWDRLMGTQNPCPSFLSYQRKEK
ncbi:MAG: AsmA-like C-terminal region-containing protein [Pseudomonadota bacterium]